MSWELSSTTPEDFHPFTWIPGREAGLKKLAAPPRWGVARSFHFSRVSEPIKREMQKNIMYVHYTTPTCTITSKLAVETKYCHTSTINTYTTTCIQMYTKTTTVFSLTGPIQTKHNRTVIPHWTSLIHTYLPVASQSVASPVVHRHLDASSVPHPHCSHCKILSLKELAMKCGGHQAPLLRQLGWVTCL